MFASAIKEWSFKEFEGKPIFVADKLERVMRANPHLRVRIEYGYYDLATPYHAAEDMVAHLRLPDEAFDRIEHEYFETGHMPYLHEPSRKREAAVDRGLRRAGAERGPARPARTPMAAPPDAVVGLHRRRVLGQPRARAAGPGRSTARRTPPGPSAASTNQRMEIRAALEAVTALDGPLLVVSDSTYVVNCFRDRWWEGWLARGWLTSAKKPVANRDLWEPLVGAVADRGDIAFRWVKGHSGHAMNDFVDGLAVAASRGA